MTRFIFFVLALAVLPAAAFADLTQARPCPAGGPDR